MPEAIILTSQALTQFPTAAEEFLYQNQWGEIALLTVGNLSERILMSNTTYVSYCFHIPPQPGEKFTESLICWRQHLSNQSFKQDDWRQTFHVSTSSNLSSQLFLCLLDVHFFHLKQMRQSMRDKDL